MNKDELFAGLTEEQKEKLKNVKTKEELMELIDEEGIELSEDTINDIAGGCFRPSA